jgi:hypothetical protein
MHQQFSGKIGRLGGPSTNRGFIKVIGDTMRVEILMVKLKITPPKRILYVKS